MHFHSASKHCCLCYRENNKVRSLRVTSQNGVILSFFLSPLGQTLSHQNDFDDIVLWGKKLYCSFFYESLVRMDENITRIFTSLNCSRLSPQFLISCHRLLSWHKSHIYSLHYYVLISKIN